MNPISQPAPVQLDPADMTPVKCNHCQGEVVLPAQKLMKLSRLNPKNPTGQDQYVNMPIMLCAACNKEVNP